MADRKSQSLSRAIELLSKRQTESLNCEHLLASSGRTSLLQAHRPPGEGTTSAVDKYRRVIED